MNCKNCGCYAPFSALWYCYTCSKVKEFAEKDVSKLIKKQKNNNREPLTYWYTPAKEEKHWQKESDWKQYSDDTIINKVVTEIIKRSELGKKKYWTTLDRNDLWLRERLQHLKEELMDAVNYIEKCLFMLK